MRLSSLLPFASNDARALKKQLRRAKEGLGLLAQREITDALARQMLKGKGAHRDPAVAALVEDGVLNRRVFGHKPAPVLDFYQRALIDAAPPPSSILEIGVKSGGSLMLWRSLFPKAKIVGIDIDLSRSTRDDSIVYIEADQSDAARLEEIGREHGPFDLVIDDGSHVVAHQLISLRSLFDHVSPGGLYVVEDVESPLLPNGDQYGANVWPDFVAMVFRYKQAEAVKNRDRVRLDSDSEATALALAIAPRVTDLIVSFHLFALRRADR